MASLALIRQIPGVKDAKHRAPRPIKNSRGVVTGEDHPKLISQVGELTVAVGLLGISFATRSIARVRGEQVIIKRMWDSKTTVKGLRLMAERGESLPQQCLVAGRLKADGYGVTPLTPKIKPLHPLLGSIDQPKNFFIALYEIAKETKIVAAGLAKMGLKIEEVPDVVDDFTTRKNAWAGNANYAVSELLVERLGCEATKKTTRQANGGEKIEIYRNPRCGRFNVHHYRQVSAGLHLASLEGEDADMELPPYDISSGESPSLFLTLPDPMHGFKRYLTHLMKGVIILNANKPFTHLSRFIFLDQCSHSDDGNRFPAPPPAHQQQSEVASSSARVPVAGSAVSVAAPPPVGEGVLDSLGTMSPHGWHWDPKAFYDNRPGPWSRWNAREVISYREFGERVHTAAELNAQYQDATKYTPEGMRQMRDKENCFRVVELGIPMYAEVVVLAKPVSQEGPRPIKLVAPDPPACAAEIDRARFQFRILQGHTVENLLKHRNASIQVYYGFAVMGLFTVWQGADWIRDAVEVTF